MVLRELLYIAHEQPCFKSAETRLHTVNIVTQRSTYVESFLSKLPLKPTTHTLPLSVLSEAFLLLSILHICFLDV